MIARYKRDGAAEWCMGTVCQAQAVCTVPGSILLSIRHTCGFWSGPAKLGMPPAASGLLGLRRTASAIKQSSQGSQLAEAVLNRETT